MPRKKYQRLMDWEKQAIVDAYVAGEKLLAIACEFDTIESTVSRIAERRGLARRTYVGPRSGLNKMAYDPNFRAIKRKLAEQRRKNVEMRAAARTHGQQ